MKFFTAVPFKVGFFKGRKYADLRHEDFFSEKSRVEKSNFLPLNGTLWTLSVAGDRKCQEKEIFFKYFLSTWTESIQKISIIKK